MKKVMVLFVLMVSITALAQKPEHGRGHKGEMKNLTPEQMATLQTKQMTLVLDLSTSQQKQVQDLNLENAQSRAKKRNELKAKKESGTANKPTSKERYAMKIAILDHQIAQKEKMKNILNTEQYEKWVKLKKNNQKKPKSKREQSHGKRRNS